MPEKHDSANPQNRVLQPGHRTSPDFFQSDSLLKGYLAGKLSADAQDYLWPLLEATGTKAAVQMDELSLEADRNPPQLRKRNTWGENVDEIRFHPAYWELMKIAVDSQMLRLKWEPELRNRFAGQRHKMGFALGMLYAMSESGQYCPLCMTDGVAHLIDQFCEPDDRARLLPHIYSDDVRDFYTGAMFLTEKAGGSDVGANLTAAKPLGGAHYALQGEKWFCSNVNAQIIFALARTQAEVKGTRGLSIFLVERTLADGHRNPIDIVRLKDKLGTRSMASGECLLNDTVGKLVGPEFQGFRVMAEMINLSRMYNSVAALAGGRRALIEAWQFLSFRATFGKQALDHALVRHKLWELGSLHVGTFLMVWRAIDAMDKAEAGDASEAELLRLLTPMVKRHSAEAAVYLCRESMELMGGMGYIEDTVIPKTMRDVMVLPIWEGAGNIMVLDMLRASAKSKGLATLFAEIDAIGSVIAPPSAGFRKIAAELREEFAKLGSLPQDAMEVKAKVLFTDLTLCYQWALIAQASDGPDGDGAKLALAWLENQHDASQRGALPPSSAELEALIAWNF